MKIECAEASILGRDHREAGRNNEDAFLTVKKSGLQIHLVADGCGSSPHSEVGAKLGLKLLARSLVEHESVFDPTAPEFYFEAVRLSVLKEMSEVAKSMEGRFSEIVRDYFLFTVVGALITSEYAIFFGIGDGVLIVNGESIALGKNENNEPPYLSYGLVSTTLPLGSPESLKIKVHKVVPLDGLNTFLIGSDGVEDYIRAENIALPGKSELVGPIESLWNDDRFFKNPDALRRRLFLMNRDGMVVDYESGRVSRYSGLLPDDTTIIVGRRKRTS